jgi:rod shape-determining protein MreD
VLLVAAVIQTALDPLTGALGVTPDLVLIVVVCWALLMGSEEGMLLGALGGLLLDLMSGAPLGTHTLALALIGYLAGVVTFSPIRSRVIMPALVMAGSTVLYDAIVGVILRLTGWPLPDLRTMSMVMVPSLISNALVAPLIYWPVVRILEARGGLRPEF